MTTVPSERKKALPVRAVTDVTIIIDPPCCLERWAARYTYGTEKYWATLKKEYEGWVKEFTDFLRDHRSQDANIFSVDTKVEIVCSVCSNPWELMDEGTPDVGCAHCGAELAYWQPSPRASGRMEWTCPCGVGHGDHVHSCCPEGCCQRDDYPGRKEREGTPPLGMRAEAP